MDRRVAETLRTIMSEDLYLRARLPVGELATTVRLSSSRLRHIFKAETGVSLTRFALALKLERARGLLETTRLSVKEIGGMVGICHESHFVHLFRKQYGLPPGFYRRQGRGSDTRTSSRRGADSRRTTKAAKRRHK